MAKAKNQSDVAKKYEGFFKAFNKDFGDNSGMGAARLASEPVEYKGQKIDFVSPGLGDASQLWGIPLGMATQFHGPEGSGSVDLPGFRSGRP